MASIVIPFYKIALKPTYILFLPVIQIEEFYKELSEHHNILIELKSIDLNNPNDSDIFIQIEEK